MTSISITIKPSFEQLSKKFSNLEIQGFLQGEIRKFALLTQDFAKQLTPVDTGRLRSSIGTSFLQPLGAIVSTNVEYSVFVHEGTGKMRARPFMERGADFAKKSWEGLIGTRLEQHITDKFKRL